MNNLWPDFKQVVVAIASPKSIIDQAGSGVKQKTDGLVHFYTGTLSISEGIGRLNCSLYAPRLSYHYPFMKVKFPVATFYPLELIVDKIDQPLVAQDENHLLQLLHEAFSAPTTIATVTQLMTLSG